MNQPIGILALKQMLKDGILYNQDIEGMVSNIETEIADAVTFARESPLPEEQGMLEGVYAP